MNINAPVIINMTENEIRDIIRKALNDFGWNSHAMVRSWAVENGYHVGKRGRIPREIVAAYDKAHQ